MTRHVTIDEAKDRLDELIDQVRRGDEVVLTDKGDAVVRMSPVHATISDARGPRKPGSAKGQVWMSEDFDAPLPKEILDLFYK